MRGMGVDSGLHTYGWAVISEGQPEQVGFFETKRLPDLLPAEDFLVRSQALIDYVWHVLSEHRPEFVAVEGFSYPRHARSAVMLAAGFTVTTTACRMLRIPLVQVRRTEVLDHFQIDRKAKTAKQRKKLIKANVLRLVDARWPHLDGWPNAKADREHPADALLTALTAWDSKKYRARLKNIGQDDSTVAADDDDVWVMASS